MNDPNAEFEENEDWSVLCAIYAESNPTMKRLPLGGFCASLEIPISTSNVAFVRRVSPDDDLALPRFRFWTLRPEESPSLDVNFYYKDRTELPKSLGISIKRYPTSWPPEKERPYVEWLTDKAQEILRKEAQSYAVCNFLEHEALNFFRVDHTDEKHGFSMVVFPSNGRDDLGLPGNYVNPRATFTYARKSGKPLTIEEYAKRTLIERWKHHFTTKCPICFDSCALGDSIQITCGHRFCFDCISSYVKHKVVDISNFRENPFTCPVDDCRLPMQVVGCAKKLLSNDDMDKVRLWYKDLKQPPVWSLDRCLSKKCNKEGAMRRPNTDPFNFHVFCDECGLTWCELCLRKIKDGQHDECCKPAVAVRFCQRYLAASDDIKQKCEEKYPWIKIYANSKTHDSASLKWIHENGQLCPVCSAGVERTEGCFHMTCSCGTHFCYECGEQLFPPFYGTHHCWEKNAFQDVG